MLILERPWTRQPQVAVDVNWAKQITRGLAFCAPLNPLVGHYDLITKQRLTTTGGLVAAVSPNGIYSTFSSSSYIDVPNNLSGITSTTPVTFAWSQYPIATTAYSTIVTWKPIGASSPFLIYQSSTDSNYYFVAGSRAGDHTLVAKFSAAAGAVTNGDLRKYCLIVPGGTVDASSASLYCNGVEIQRGTSVSTNALGASTSTVFRIGALETAGDPFEGLLGNMHIWKRALSKIEAIDWTLNEFSTLAPQQIIIPTAAAAASSLPTLSASTFVPGSVTATGWRPRVTATY